MVSPPLLRCKSATAAVLLAVTMAACERAPDPPAATPALAASFTRATYTRPSDSPEFERAFRRIHQAAVRTPTGPGGAAVRLTYCTVDPAGTAYYAGRDARELYAWSPGGAGLRRLPVRPEHRPARVGALAWSAEENALHVLDVATNRVLKYDPSGRLLDYVWLNGGQGGLTLHVLPGGRYLVGGERWEREDSATLAAVYERNGRLASAFFPMDQAAHANNMDVYIPVLIAPLEAGEFLIAEPTSYAISRVSLDGQVRQRFAEKPSGYFPPRPLPDRSRPAEEMELWHRSWTPLLFLHAADDAVYAAFQVHRPDRSYQFEIYDPDGRKLAGGLVTSSRPACGRDRRLYFVDPLAADSVQLSVYEHVSR